MCFCGPIFYSSYRTACEIYGTTFPVTRRHATRGDRSTRFSSLLFNHFLCLDLLKWTLPPKFLSYLVLNWKRRNCAMESQNFNYKIILYRHSHFPVWWTMILSLGFATEVCCDPIFGHLALVYNFEFCGLFYKYS